MNLGNAFSRRKQLQAEINTWISRLTLAHRNTKKYQTKDTKNEPYEPIPGTIKEFKRSYSIEECKTKLESLIKEDQNLALQISLTNQMAKSKLIDLDGKEKEMTIPELLVLKNNIAPKYEQMLRAIPKRATGVEITDKGDNHIKFRTITPKYKEEQSMGEKGQVMKNEVLDYYFVEEVVDYGWSQRDIFDEIDKIQGWSNS